MQKQTMQSQHNLSARPTSKSLGDQAEVGVLHWLTQNGLNLLKRNYKTPGRGGGEIDLIMQEPDGTVVFVEVRLRQNTKFGGALSSVGVTKQRRLIYAAQVYLSTWTRVPPCRFDVVAVGCQPEAGHLPAGLQMNWVKAAFDVI